MRAWARVSAQRATLCQGRALLQGHQSQACRTSLKNVPRPFRESKQLYGSRPTPFPCRPHPAMAGEALFRKCFFSVYLFSGLILSIYLVLE